MEKIYLDMLNENFVSIRKQQIVLGADGKEYIVGEPWRKAYVNSTKGRTELQNEVPDPYKSVVMMLWGTTPTITEEQD